MTKLMGICVMLAACSSVGAGELERRFVEQITDLRESREKSIAEALDRINADYARAVKDLGSRSAAKSQERKFAKEELERLKLIALNKMPPDLVVGHPFKAGNSKFDTPRIRKKEELISFLIGTSWEVFGNGEFMGEATALIFKSPTKAERGGEEIDWKATENDKIWLQGNIVFSLSKDFSEMNGHWAPNSRDKKTARRTK